MANDAFSQWLGIEIVEISEGFCRLSMQIRKGMTNGFGFAHGGIVYSLADSALAFAANTYGLKSVTVDGHMHYFQKLHPGDKLIAEAKVIHKGKKISKFTVNILLDDALVAKMLGSIVHTKMEW
jgi:acyl-CoA thioesterase